ncbi:helix-turn-helix domain-containing protein [Pseudomonas sp. HR96]|uniref:helix-turn-helix domain-containing protein n=1 Tax=Pseudomonas sp. HR96 TaxID=1027966 RepID=UPI002A75B602|nr:helix-turn-helix domain-containing protein [Pseudomonas sp. HR96]WPO98932.1 helix-turn-helix domain-containing protein [Pseudomonas sp. HR96]
MDIQVISRDGQPEYAIVPWDQYQALLQAAGVREQRPAAPTASPAAAVGPAAADSLPAFSELRRLREAKALAAATLARAVGISPSYLSMIESGEREPDAAIRRSLAWELGVPGWREAS